MTPSWLSRIFRAATIMECIGKQSFSGKDGIFVNS